MIIADSGFWVAFFNRRDAHHTRARECVRHLRESLITTWPVVTETCYLLQQRAGTSLAVTFIGCLRQGGASIFQIEDAMLARAEELM